MVVVNIGARIRAARKQSGLKQQELSEAVGIEPESLSRIETGKLKPSRATVEQVAAHLGIKVGQLLDEAELRVPRPQVRPIERRLLRLVRELDDEQVEILVRALENLLRLGAQIPIARRKS